MTTARLITVFSFLAVLPLQAQQFGASAAIGNGELLIGEPVKPNEAAVIHVYRRGAGGWEESGTLKAPAHEGSDYFGRFIVMDDRSLIVGGTTLDSSSGQAWAYRRNGRQWTFVNTLRPADVKVGDSFGRVGLLRGDLLFITALGHNESRGAVWVFHRDNRGAWTQEAKLTPGDSAAAQEFFGWSIAFNGERALIGAIQPNQQQQQRGAAYIFRRNGPGDWALETRLALDSAESQPGDAFGMATAWLDGQALIGMPGHDGGTGEVRTYHVEMGNWVPGVVLSAWAREPGTGFGSTIALSGGEVWVGAPGADEAGRVYRFTYDAGTKRFGAAQKMAGMDEDVGDNFGGMLAMNDNVAVVGALGDDFGLGSAVVLERSGADWKASTKLLGPAPASLPALTNGETDCASGKANQFPCSNVNILSFLPVSAIGGGRGAETNDVWGWTDPQSGKEYALVGRTDGTAFIDVTNALRPVYLGNLPKTPGSRGNAWRDIKVYKNHAYIVADGAGDAGMQVFDLTHLRNVTAPPVAFQEDAHYTGVASVHNIVIDTASGFAYAVGSNSGGETCGGGLHMIDIRSPKQPTFAGCFADTTTGIRKTGYTHDAQCVVYHGPDQSYQGKEICFNSNETALEISDVSDKKNPKPISVAAYPNVGYTHQGWLTDDQRYFFMDDEGDESNAVQAGHPMSGTRTLIWDVADLDDPIMVKEHFGTTFTIDHNLYIKGNLMYQSNYVSGLRVLDISDPMNPREVGFLDTVPWSERVEFDGSWSNYPFFASGTIIVTSMKEGVFMVRYQRMVP